MIVMLSKEKETNVLIKKFFRSRQTTNNQLMLKRPEGIFKDLNNNIVCEPNELPNTESLNIPSHQKFYPSPSTLKYFDADAKESQLKLEVESPSRRYTFLATNQLENRVRRHLQMPKQLKPAAHRICLVGALFNCRLPLYRIKSIKQTEVGQ